jgi:hypothetical protein
VTAGAVSGSLGSAAHRTASAGPRSDRRPLVLQLRFARCYPGLPCREVQDADRRGDRWMGLALR